MLVLWLLFGQIEGQGARPEVLMEVFLSKEDCEVATSIVAKHLPQAKPSCVEYAAKVTRKGSQSYQDQDAVEYGP